MKNKNLTTANLNKIKLTYLSPLLMANVFVIEMFLWLLVWSKYLWHWWMRSSVMFLVTPYQRALWQIMAGYPNISLYMVLYVTLYQMFWQTSSLPLSYFGIYGTLKVWLHLSGHFMLDGLGFHKSVSLWLNTASVLTATVNGRVWVGASLDTVRWKVL